MQIATAVSASFFAALLATTCHATSCTVPNNIANGQVADASQVMGNFNAVASCVDTVDGKSVTTTGTVASGGVAVFSGSRTIMSGVLTGDVTTAAGTTTASLAPSGVAAGTYSNPTIAVDTKGRITSAVNGAGSGGSGGGLSQNYNHFNALNLPVPTTANFTTTASTSFGSNFGLQAAAMGVSLYGGNSSFAFGWADQAIANGGTTGDFSVTGLIKLAALNSGNYAVGITLGDGTHRVTWGFRNTQLWMSHTNGNDSYDSIGGYGGDIGAISSPTLFRIRRTGATMYFEIALDGKNFDVVTTESATAYLPANITTYGIGILPNGSYQRIVCYGLLGQ